MFIQCNYYIILVTCLRYILEVIEYIENVAFNTMQHLMMIKEEEYISTYMSVVLCINALI